MGQCIGSLLLHENEHEPWDIFQVGNGMEMEMISALGAWHIHEIKMQTATKYSHLHTFTQHKLSLKIVANASYWALNHCHRHMFHMQ